MRMEKTVKVLPFLLLLKMAVSRKIMMNTLVMIKKTDQDLNRMKVAMMMKTVKKNQFQRKSKRQINLPSSVCQLKKEHLNSWNKTWTSDRKYSFYLIKTIIYSVNN